MVAIYRNAAYPAGANQKKRRDLLDSIASTEQNSVQLSVETHSNRSSESFSESELDGSVRGNERGSLSEVPVSSASDSCSSSIARHSTESAYLSFWSL